MKNTIIETINGLKIAKEEREKMLLDVQTKDYTTIVTEYKAKLEEEIKAKLAEYIDNIENERSKSANKLTQELATINELCTEFGDKLTKIEAEETVNTVATIDNIQNINTINTTAEHIENIVQTGTI